MFKQLYLVLGLLLSIQLVSAQTSSTNELVYEYKALDFFFDSLQKEMPLKDVKFYSDGQITHKTTFWSLYKIWQDSTYSDLYQEQLKKHEDNVESFYVDHKHKYSKKRLKRISRKKFRKIAKENAYWLEAQKTIAHNKEYHVVVSVSNWTRKRLNVEKNTYNVSVVFDLSGNIKRWKYQER